MYAAVCTLNDESMTRLPANGLQIQQKLSEAPAVKDTPMMRRKGLQISMMVDLYENNLVADVIVNVDVDVDDASMLR